MQTTKDSRPRTSEGGTGWQGAGSRLVFYEDGFVFDTVSGLFFRLNPTAAFALRALAEGAEPDELPEKLQRRYDLDHQTAVRDAELFLDDLAALGLLAERDS